jgi:hypothetical protein
MSKCEAPAYRSRFPGHAVASSMRAKEASFILCPPWSGLIDLTLPIQLWRDGARSVQQSGRRPPGLDHSGHLKFDTARVD